MSSSFGLADSNENIMSRIGKKYSPEESASLQG